MSGPGRGRFLWGAATSSHQVEGGNQNNDWWAWEQQGQIEGGARSGAATDHWNRFREDLDLLRELGLNSYRFSIEWSRIEPEEGRWDPEAMDWYRELVHECERRAIVPMATLHHFTSPLWLAARGGFTWEKSPERFARYVGHVARELGPRVPLWCTINEPMVLALGAYLGNFMPPARFDPAAAAECCRNLLRCHVAAYEALHSGIPSRAGPWRELPIAVGIAHNMMDFLPDRRSHPLDHLLAVAFWKVYNRAWLDAVTGRRQGFGVPFLMPRARQVPEALGRVTADFIGVNYYTKGYCLWRPRSAGPGRPSELPIGVSFARRKEPQSDLQWAVHPGGFRRILRFASRYGLPLYVTENGIADHADALRPGYLISHLSEVARAVRHGIDLRGYFHWSLMDNFEWVKGFAPRFGLYRVDFETQARIPTRSAKLLQRLIEAHTSSTGHPFAPREQVLDLPEFSCYLQNLTES